MAILSYLGLLLLIPLLMGTHKTSPYVKFHLNQGIVVGFIFVGAFLLSIIGIVFWLFLIPAYLIWVAGGVFAIMGIVFAAQGRLKELPIIGSFTILK